MSITADTPVPEALQDFARQLCDTLPDAVKRTMAAQYEQLMSAQHQATGSTWFLVGRTVYAPGQCVHDQNIVRNVGNVRPLVPGLLPAFRAWERPFKQLESDLARIHQTLSSIVMRATSWQDVRNMFPEHFIRPLLGTGLFSGMQRTSLDLYAGPPVPFAPPTQERLDREAIWDPRLLNMYERVGSLIDLYLGYKLL